MTKADDMVSGDGVLDGMVLGGIVLCGGQSSRMGRNKMHLRYHGQALFEHMRGLLWQAGVDDVFLSGADGIADSFVRRGPLGGIHAAVTALTGRFSHLLFVPVDMPLLKPVQLSALANHKCDADTAVHYMNSIFPLRLRLCKQLQNTIELQLQSNEGASVRKLLYTLCAERLTVTHGDEDCFANLNTPIEWNAATGNII